MKSVRRKLNLFIFLSLLLTLLTSAITHAKPAEILDIDLKAPEHNKNIITLQFNKQVPYQLFTLNNPMRVVIDFNHTNINKPLRAKPFNSMLLKRIRSFKHENKLRMVFDVRTKLHVKSAYLKTNELNEHSFIIEFNGQPNEPPLPKNNIMQNKQAPAFNQTQTKPKLRDVIIAIDAGHGGNDPGAIGAKGTQEKDITLAIAKELYQLILAQKGMRPFLIRKSDHYIKLKERVKIARKINADLFVSIHADSFKNAKASGSSIFILSETKASSAAAKWLAQRENHADFIAGVGDVDLIDKDETVAKVLLDLSLTSSLEASEHAANAIIKQMGKINKLHQEDVQKAGFLVLKSPDVPSVLIETAFLSNPQEEKKLRTKQYQKQMAHSILKGIREYFIQNGPSDTLLAQNTHKVQPGDSLSVLAEKYDISLQDLKTWNQLSSTTIQPGQILSLSPHQ